MSGSLFKKKIQNLSDKKVFKTNNHQFLMPRKKKTENIEEKKEEVIAEAKEKPKAEKKKPAEKKEKPKEEKTETTEEEKKDEEKKQEEFPDVEIGFDVFGG
jgi:hypothetical protein